MNAVRVDSSYAPAYYNMGGILANKGKYDDARQSYLKYLSWSDSADDTLDVMNRIRILSTLDR